MSQSKFLVPHDLTTEERIAALKCLWGEDEAKSFSHDPSTAGYWEYDLYNSSISISTKAAMLRVELGGWSAPKAEHLIAYINMLQEVPVTPVVALGAMCTSNDIQHVLGFSSTKDGYGFSLYQCEGPWRDRFDFLRVRRVQQ